MCATWHECAHSHTSSHMHIHIEGVLFLFCVSSRFQGNRVRFYFYFQYWRLELGSVHATCELLFIFIFYHKTGSHQVAQSGLKLTVACRQALTLVCLLLHPEETWMTVSHRVQLRLYFDDVMILKPSFFSYFPSATHRSGTLERVGGTRP